LAEAILHEPEWLAARRERAASLRDELDLPRFKGTTGWEFTDLGKFELSNFGPAPDNQGGGGATVVELKE